MSSVFSCDWDKRKTKRVKDGAILNAIYLLLWGVVITLHKKTSALSNTMLNNNGEYWFLSKSRGHAMSWPLSSIQTPWSHFSSLLCSHFLIIHQQGLCIESLESYLTSFSYLTNFCPWIPLWALFIEIVCHKTVTTKHSPVHHEIHLKRCNVCLLSAAGPIHLALKILACQSYFLTMNQFPGDLVAWPQIQRENVFLCSPLSNRVK